MSVAWLLWVGASWAFYIDADGDGFPQSIDCNDNAREIYPGAPEVVANGIDESCDGRELCYVDSDGDRFGSLDTIDTTDFSCSVGGVSDNPDDCDDTRSDVYPTAVEVPLDHVDQTCDGLELCAIDNDVDGYGIASYLFTTDLDCIGFGYADNTDDCDDTDGNVNPGEPEVPADGVDSNCTGLELCYADADGDAYGSTATVTTTDVSCSSSGVADNAEDCDDGAPQSYPGAPEVDNDGIDQDCNGADLADCYVDDDGDGYGRGQKVLQAFACVAGSGWAYEKGDCDDTDAAISPAATEVPLDGTDQDCDGFELCYLDSDLDGIGTETTTLADLACSDAGASLRADDCDDTDADASPLLYELTCDGRDNDCDPATADAPDLDGDGVSFCDGDCDDTDPNVSPAATEVPLDGIDQDCDGSEICFLDEDGDGIGTETTTLADLQCADPGASVRSDDCDDTLPGVSPLATETTCDGLDNDCDPATADDPDNDGDGYTFCTDDCNDDDFGVNPGVSEVLCNIVDDDCDPKTIDGVDNDGDSVSICAGDCNDGDPNISPLQAEIECTGIDEDCDPLTRDSTDSDGDGIATCDGDCNDLDPTVNPGVPEVPCNGVNDDCNPATPDGCIDSADTAPTGDTATTADTGPTGDTAPQVTPTSVTGDTAPPTTLPTTDTAPPVVTPPTTGGTTLPDGKAVEPAAPSYGFGCSGVAAPPAGWLALLPAVALGRRRRR